MSTHSLRDLISLSLLPAKPLKVSLKRSTNRASRDAYMAMYSSNSMRASRWRSGDMGNFLLKAGSGGMGGQGAATAALYAMPCCTEREAHHYCTKNRRFNKCSTP